MNDKYIYLDVPDNYKDIYNSLLKSIIGINTNCILSYNKLIKYWNVFQCALASYYLGKIHEADKCIEYIKIKLYEYNIETIKDNIIIFNSNEVNVKNNILTIKRNAIVNNSILKITNDNYTYLIIPIEYKDTYDKLIKLLYNIGTNIVKVCNCKIYINDFVIWQLFKSACILYDNDKEKSIKIINYINNQLK